MANDVCWDTPLDRTPAERLVVLTPSLLRAADELLAALARLDVAAADVRRHTTVLHDTITIITEEE